MGGSHGKVTINVEYLRERANYFLANSEPEAIEQRKGVISMIELALHKSGNYNGFNYLESAGMERDEEGYAKTIRDETRVYYYQSSALGRWADRNQA